MTTIYINRKQGRGIETVDQITTKEDARHLVGEYRMADPTAEYYASRRPTKDWPPALSLYAVEFTDTYAGEANYCWVQRFTVRAKDIKQAITRAKKHRYAAPVPKHTLSLYDNGSARIDLKTTPICAFIDWIDATDHDADKHGEIIN